MCIRVTCGGPAARCSRPLGIKQELNCNYHIYLLIHELIACWDIELSWQAACCHEDQTPIEMMTRFCEVWSGCCCCWSCPSLAEYFHLLSSYSRHCRIGIKLWIGMWWIKDKIVSFFKAWRTVRSRKVLYYTKGLSDDVRSKNILVPISLFTIDAVVEEMV